MSKRTATTLAASTTKSKKPKRAPSPSPSADSGSAEEFDDFEDLEQAEDDSEIDEFAQGNEADEDDEMISDDGEDLMAGLDEADDESQDAPSLGDDDDDDEEEEDDDDHSDEDVGDTDLTAALAPAPAVKSKTRNSRAPKPLSPAEIRALAFAELTASPISSSIANSVSIFLATITPPKPATSPLQPLLKALHAHIVSLPSIKPISLDSLRKRGLVVPPIEGGKGKWAALEYEFEKPKSDEVRVVGKWAWGGGVKVGGEYKVELAVAMPKVSITAHQTRL